MLEAAKLKAEPYHLFAVFRYLFSDAWLRAGASGTAPARLLICHFAEAGAGFDAGRAHLQSVQRKSTANTEIDAKSRAPVPINHDNRNTATLLGRKPRMNPAFKIAVGLAVTTSILWGGLSAPAEAADRTRVGRPTGLWLSPRKVNNGQTLLLQIYTRKIRAASTAMKIIFQQREYPVYRHPLDPGHRCFGLVAIPFRSPPGPARLTLKWTNAAGNHTRTMPFKIVAGKYRTDELKVDAARVTPSKKNIKRVQKETRTVNRAYASGNVAGLWDGPFQLPIKSRITSLFGNKRLFNGKLKSYHNGVDFRAAIGTPVRAVNSGIVRVAKNLFYSGDAVIIDHGNNIFALYAHLSKVKVNVGQQVEKGQQIGLSGATGRVNAPHLHWGVKINGVAADPMQFIKVMAALTGGRR